MPIIKSAKKRARQTVVATTRNQKFKKSLKTALKSFEAAVKKGDSKEVSEALVKAQSAVDTAAKKNLIHKNKAARKVASLNKTAKTLGAAPAKKAVKAPAAAKPAAAKKPAAKTAPKATPKAATKSPAKKPAVKKTAAKK
jgi:ribosomal protein S20